MRRTNALRAGAPYTALALATAAVLFFSLELGRRNLRVPFEYLGDGLFYTVVTKAVAEQGFSRFERLGAPFGMDLFDWPTGMLFDFSILGLLARGLGEAGLALNLYWLGSVVATALLAAWALRRLGLETALAFPLGLLYGLLPYAFYRNVGHISMVYHFVPLLALRLVRVSEGRPEAAGRGERFATAAACVLQGLSYPYYGLFAAALLVVAGALGSVRARGLAPARAAVATIALLGASTLANLTPSVLYWRAHGANPELQYKTVADSDGYGLKIRHLITPILDHPLPPLRWAASRVAEAGFPLENENAGAKIGLVASVGFAYLLWVSLTGAAGRGRGAASDRLAAVAGVNLGALLLATIGGLGSLFAVFVSAQVRAWNRIAVFIAFFGLVAVGLLMQGWLDSWRARGRTLGRAAPAVGAALLGLFVFDQVSASHLESRREEYAQRHARDEAYVRHLERLLAPGGRVFQLPHTPTPVDASVSPLQPYDNARLYLHSRTLGWSWGAISGRHGNWQAEVARLAPPEMVRRLALAGFSAVLVDRFGWARGRGNPYAHGDASPEGALAAAARLPVEASADGRHALVLLSDVRRRLEDALGPEGLVRASREALRPPVVARWPRGFTALEGDGTSSRRFGGATARIVFRNALPFPRTVVIEARIRASDPRGGTLRLRGLVEDDLALGAEAVHWQRTVRLPSLERARIDFTFESPTACPRAERCFEVTDFSSSDLETVELTPESGAADADQEPGTP